MSSFKLRISLLKIWFLKNIVLFLEIVAVVLFILTFTGVLSPNFPIFGQIVQEVRKLWYENESPDIWIKALTTITSCLMSVGMFMVKAKNIALSDIKNDNLKKALINANLYFNEKGHLVKKLEKATNTDIDGDGKVADKDVGEAKANVGFFSGIRNAVQELVAIATVKLDDKDEEKNKENYDNVINENNMTDAAEVMGDLEKANEVRKSVQRTETADNVIDSRIGDVRDSESLSEEQKENDIKFLERIRAFFHNLFRVKTDEEKAEIKAKKEKKKAEKLQKKEEAKQMRAALKAEKAKAKKETTEVVKEDKKEVKTEQKTIEAVKPVVKEVKAPAPVKAEVKKEISSVDAFIASLRR